MSTSGDEPLITPFGGTAEGRPSLPSFTPPHGASEPPSVRPHRPQKPGLLRPLALLLVLLALVSAARSFSRSVEGQELQSGAALGAGLALLGGLFAGEIFSVLRLPRITGYLCMGMLAGPDGLDVVTKRMLGDLRLVNGVSIGLIALTAGLELNFKKLRSKLLSIGMMGASSIVTVLVVITGVSLALSSFLPQFDASMSIGERFAVSLLTATVYATVSPSVAIAIIGEAGAEGPVSETSMGVVVLGDIALVVGFAAVNAYVAGVFSASGGGGDAAGPGVLFFEIFGSLGLGVAIGFLLSIYVRRVARRTALFVFGLCFLIAEVGSRLHFDPLLVCLAAGLVIENLTPVTGTSLAHDLEVASVPTFAVFFCVAGAGIHLHALAHVAPWAILFAVLRGGSLFFGGRFGGKLAKAPEAVTQWAPFGLLPQAGIAIGLAVLVQKQFGQGMHGDKPAWGARLAELLLGTIAINELFGPMILRWALGRAGEAGRRAPVSGGH
jgi:Kef-type K+ transport system membrane component KefB